MDIEQLPQHRNIGGFKVVDRILQFVGVADVAVFHSRCPLDVIDRIHALQEGREPLQSIGNFGGDQIQVDTAALLEVSELGNLQPIQHHLPAHSPRA